MCRSSCSTRWPSLLQDHAARLMLAFRYLAAWVDGGSSSWSSHVEARHETSERQEAKASRYLACLLIPVVCIGCHWPGVSRVEPDVQIEDRFINYFAIPPPTFELSLQRALLALALIPVVGYFASAFVIGLTLPRSCHVCSSMCGSRGSAAEGKWCRNSIQGT